MLLAIWIRLPQVSSNTAVVTRPMATGTCVNVAGGISAARHTPRLALDRNNMGHRTSHELGENNLINRIESLHIKAGLARGVLSRFDSRSS